MKTVNILIIAAILLITACSSAAAGGIKEKPASDRKTTAEMEKGGTITRSPEIDPYKLGLAEKDYRIKSAVIRNFTPDGRIIAVSDYSFEYKEDFLSCLTIKQNGKMIKNTCYEYDPDGFLLAETNTHKQRISDRNVYSFGKDTHKKTAYRDGEIDSVISGELPAQKYYHLTDNQLTVFSEKSDSPQFLHTVREEYDTANKRFLFTSFSKLNAERYFYVYSKRLNRIEFSAVEYIEPVFSNEGKLIESVYHSRKEGELGRVVYIYSAAGRLVYYELFDRNGTVIESAEISWEKTGSNLVFLFW